MKNPTNDKWEIKSDDVIICEELGHGAFGKVCKGIMKTPSCMTHGSSVHKTSKKIAKSTTITVAVKMLQGMLPRTVWQGKKIMINLHGIFGIFFSYLQGPQTMCYFF